MTDITYSDNTPLLQNFDIKLPSLRVNLLGSRLHGMPSLTHVDPWQGFIQDQIIASHTCFGGHVDVNC